ncbi:MAG: hypothetical protein ACLSHG_07945 [Oscillospiraceae bacterium]
MPSPTSPKSPAGPSRSRTSTSTACASAAASCARSNALLPDVIAMTITVIRDTVSVSGREQRAPARHHSLAGQAHR